MTFIFVDCWCMLKTHPSVRHVEGILRRCWSGRWMHLNAWDWLDGVPWRKAIVLRPVEHMLLISWCTFPLASITVLDAELNYWLFEAEYCAAVPVWYLEQKQSGCKMVRIWCKCLNSVLLEVCFKWKIMTFTIRPGKVNRGSSIWWGKSITIGHSIVITTYNIVITTYNFKLNLNSLQKLRVSCLHVDAHCADSTWLTQFRRLKLTTPKVTQNCPKRLKT